jgi:hypothetical protein
MRRLKTGAEGPRETGYPRNLIRKLIFLYFMYVIKSGFVPFSGKLIYNWFVFSEKRVFYDLLLGHRKNL